MNFTQMLKTREPTLLDHDDGHWYQTKFDKIYPSISTILSSTASEETKMDWHIGRKMNLHMNT